MSQISTLASPLIVKAGGRDHAEPPTCHTRRRFRRVSEFSSSFHAGATVTVTNRGQNGYRDDVVQQQVACGSQYYDGYRTRTAPRC